MNLWRVWSFAAYGLAAFLAPFWFPWFWPVAQLIYSSGAVYLVFMALMVLAYCLCFARSGRQVVPQFVVPMFLVLIVGAVAGMLNQHWLGTLMTDKTIRSRFLFVVFLPGLLLCLVLFRRAPIRYHLGTLGLIGVLASLSLWMQWFLADRAVGMSRPIVPIDSSGSYERIVRLDGHFSAPVVAATVMLACWPFAHDLVRSVSGSMSRKVQIALAGAFVSLQIGGILFTWTRAAYLGLLFQTFLLFIYVVLNGRGGQRRKSQHWHPITMLVMCAVVVGLFVVQTPEMVRRGLSLSNFSEA